MCGEGDDDATAIAMFLLLSRNTQAVILYSSPVCNKERRLGRRQNQERYAAREVDPGLILKYNISLGSHPR